MAVTLTYGPNKWILSDTVDVDELRRNVYNAAHTGGSAKGDWVETTTRGGKRLSLYISAGAHVALLETAGGDYDVADSVL